ncbi:TPA: hypothetical protein OMQ57_000073 [Acinetobacter baumannii]|nr:hypothetical protein [Acinetobacter baumannii]
MKLKYLCIVLILGLSGCNSKADVDSTKSYKAVELLKNAQETILANNKSAKVVFKNEQIRTKKTYSVACGEYGLIKSFWDRNVSFNRYVIFEKDHIILEQKANSNPVFDDLWNKNCIG